MQVRTMGVFPRDQETTVVRVLTLLCLAVILSCSSGHTEPVVVRPDGSGDFPTIQAAVDAVQDGDVVELTDGVSVGAGNRDMDFRGKAISLVSQSRGPESCILRCEGSEAAPHRGMGCQSAESSLSLIEGITITGGYAEGPGLPDDTGGAILCLNASPALRDCRFVGNRAGFSGHGIQCVGSTAATSGRHSLDNSCFYQGGGLTLAGYSNPALIDCVCEGNRIEVRV